MNHICKLPLGVYDKAISNYLSWEEKLTVVKQSGFDYLEVGIDGMPDRLPRLYDENCALELRRAIEKTGVPVYTMALTANRAYPLGSEDEAIRAKGIEIVKKGIRFAFLAGIRVVHVAGYDDLGEKGNNRTKELFVASIRECVEAAASQGVILAIETMDTAYMGSCKNIMNLCREIDSPYLQCYADIGNLTASGVDFAEDIALAGKHIVGLHLKDTTPGIYRDVLFGDGNVDFESGFRALEAIGYHGFMAAEMWSYDNDEFHSYLPKASKFLREKMERI